MSNILTTNYEQNFYNVIKEQFLRDWKLRNSIRVWKTVNVLILLQMCSQIISFSYFRIIFLVFTHLDFSKSSFGNAWKPLSSNFVVMNSFLIIRFHSQYILSLKISNNISFLQWQWFLPLEVQF